MRAFLALGLGALAISMVGMGILMFVVQPQILRLEEELASRELHSFLSVLDHEAEKLQMFAREYAWWDETWDWMSGTGPDYSGEYLAPDVMAAQQVEFLALVDKEGRWVHSATYRNGARQPFALDEDLRTSFTYLLARYPGAPPARKGLIMLGESLCTVAAVEIRGNDGTLPFAGFFLAGHLLDNQHLKALVAGADLQARVILRNGSAMPPASAVSVVHELVDPSGAPVALVEVAPRPTVREANARQVQVLALAYLGGTLLLVLSAWLWLRIQVLGPLSLMAGQAGLIRQGAGLNHRLATRGSREFRELADGFNLILDKLEARMRRRDRELATAGEQLYLMGEAFNHALDGIFICSLDGTIISVNPAFTTITGYEGDEVLGRNPRFLKSGLHDSGFYRAMWRALEEDGAWTGEVWDRRKDGRLVPVWLSLSAIWDGSGRAENYMAVMHDITTVKDQEKAMHFQAFYDPLTSLPNRLLLRDRMDKALVLNARKGLKVAVLFLDLDNFKHVNDSLGHGAGDLLLVEVSKRLKTLVRPSDTVCRLGGDEFVIMLEELPDEKAAIHLASRILETLRAPVEAEGHQLLVSTSIGICISPDDGTTVEVLLRNADAAMYRAKDGGKDSFALFLPEMNERALKRIRLEQDLPRAIQDGAIRVWYQPKYDLARQCIVGAEALVRWYRDGAVIQPVDFVPMAEDLGLVGNLDLEVLYQTSRDHGVILRETGQNLVLAVNCSPKVLHQPDLADRIVCALDRGGMAASSLELEITETSLMKDFASSLRSINRLDSLGISLALDDFGTGYSSLVQLNRLPVSTLKIDRSFVVDLCNYQTANIVGTILTMARGLNIKVVAEGVEEDWQMEFLRANGCDMVQGYLVSRPVPLEELILLLKNGSSQAIIPAAAEVPEAV